MRKVRVVSDDGFLTYLIDAETGERIEDVFSVELSQKAGEPMMAEFVVRRPVSSIDVKAAVVATAVAQEKPKFTGMGDVVGMITGFEPNEDGNGVNLIDQQGNTLVNVSWERLQEIHDVDGWTVDEVDGVPVFNRQNSRVVRLPGEAG